MAGSLLTGFATILQGAMQGKLEAKQTANEMQRQAIMDALQQRQFDQYRLSQELYRETAEAEAQRQAQTFRIRPPRSYEEEAAFNLAQELETYRLGQERAEIASGRMLEWNLPAQIGVAERPTAVTPGPMLGPAALTAPYIPGAPALSPQAPAGALPSLRTSILPELTAPIEQLGEPVQIPREPGTVMAPTLLGPTAEASLREKVRAFQGLGGRVTGEVDQYGYPTKLKLPPTWEEEETTRITRETAQTALDTAREELRQLEDEWPYTIAELEDEADKRALDLAIKRPEAMLADVQRLIYERAPEALIKQGLAALAAETAILKKEAELGLPREKFPQEVINEYGSLIAATNRYVADRSVDVAEIYTGRGPGGTAGGPVQLGAATTVTEADKAHNKFIDYVMSQDAHSYDEIGMVLSKSAELLGRLGQYRPPMDTYKVHLQDLYKDRKADLNAKGIKSSDEMISVIVGAAGYDERAPAPTAPLGTQPPRGGTPRPLPEGPQPGAWSPP